ncbi:hypothetical protein CYY_003266 [Polysphondylium violaceum]|uniref:WD40 repeat-containing protein n=1 Tax=Polysphondylium violaceum TaxID=133409 RepID=A0A8J4V637_9MYCE|nr:hypothetical protein CYY_003266 [Polysphondylium violaceum]
MSSGSDDTSGVEDDDEYFDIVDDDDSISDDDIEDDDSNNTTTTTSTTSASINRNRNRNTNNNRNRNNINQQQQQQHQQQNNNRPVSPMPMEDSSDSDDYFLENNQDDNDDDDDDYTDSGEQDDDDDYEAEHDNADDLEFLADQDEDDLDEDDLAEQRITFYQLLNTLSAINSRSARSDRQFLFSEAPQEREEQQRIQSEKHNQDLLDLKNEKITLQYLSRVKDTNTPLNNYLLNRELTDQNVERIRISQYFLPSRPLNIINVHHKIFCCKMSSDGKIFMSASQDKMIRFFHTDSWQEFKSIEARDINWSIIDTDYSPDQNWLVYSSWSPYIQLCKIKSDNDQDSEVPLPKYNDFDSLSSSSSLKKPKYQDIHEALFLDPIADRFCIFGLKFSPNNKEILAGSSDGLIFIYDLIDRRNAIQIRGHRDDINSVTFIDKGGNLFATGSDDSLIKIWDKRILDDSFNRPIGVLTGHINGITHVSSKDDGVYLLSNGKDQCAKLWDIRKMKTQPSYCDLSYSPPTNNENLSSYWNQRISRQLAPTKTQLDNDISLMTYKGHKVFQTLIRCYFSPLETTGQKFIYSGSSDGDIYIYDVLSGEIIRVLNHGQGTVRDLSWSPCSQELISTNWQGYITKWCDWNDIRYDDY